jgi:hypothetical protein
MFSWELVEGDEPLPIGEQALDGFGGQRIVARHKLRPELLTRGLALRVGHRT